MMRSWDLYFTKIAEQVATRSTCDRAQVGAVFVSEDRIILATGYNGSIRGQPHCQTAGCVMVSGHCTNTVHAELNGVGQAARVGVKLLDSTLYVTHFPCWNCFKVLANVGIQEINYLHQYGSDLNVSKVSAQVGIRLHKV